MRFPVEPFVIVTAVVADVIECAREKKFVDNGLTGAEIKLNDINDRAFKFFVRVSNKEDALKRFSNVQEIAANFNDEFAFITDLMSGREFDEKISGLDVKNSLRLL